MLLPWSSDSQSGDSVGFYLLGYNACWRLLVGLLLGLLLGLENGGDMFLPNVRLHRTIWCYIPEDKIRNSVSTYVLFQLIILMT
jgi:hypothetical protein